MMLLAARVTKIAETLRTKGNAVRDGSWLTVKLPRIGDVSIHVVSQEACKEYGWNEVWARIGGEEFRGNAEAVATKLCKLLQAPSKAVGDAAEVILSKNFDGLREPEMAALYRLDEETTSKAMSLLEERGVAVDKKDLGWFRVAS